MKKTRQPSNILGICLVALACYTWLNGHALGLLLLEKDVPRFFATIIQGVSRNTGGEFVLGQVTAGLNALTGYDVVLEPAVQQALDEKVPIPKPLEEAPPAPPLPTPIAESAPATPAPLPTEQPQAAAPPKQEPKQMAEQMPEKPELRPKEAEIKPEPSVSPRSVGKKSIFDKALSQRYKVMLVGDSFMEDMLLAIQRTWHNRDPHVQYISAAKHSTGLCLSSKWDWRKKLEGFMEKYQPHVVVIFMGANDLRSIFDGEKKYLFTSPAWKQRYVEIAEEMLDIVRRGNATPIWIGLPVMGHEQYAKWVPLISDMQKKAALNKGAIYLDTTPFLGDAEGRYRIFTTDASGERIRLRKADNYHVADAGSQMILDHLVPHLRTSIWEKEKMYVLSKKGVP